MFCTLSKQIISGYFFFAERTVTGVVHQDMLEEFLMPILEEPSPDDMLFQQHVVPPYFHKEVTNFFNLKFP
jgi:hypothetical protein